MHLTDVEAGAYGSFAIVGAHLPVAVGLAFAGHYRGNEELSLCFFGDGSTNIGAFHESLNLAAIWKLPVIFVCENNLYGEYSPVAITTPVSRLADRADSYAMAKEQVDGNDVAAMYEVTLAAAARARAGEGPTLIEALTYRQRGHSRSDPGSSYRPAEEVAEWTERDPIRLLERSLAEDGVAPDDVQRIRDDAAASVAAALERARGWADPDPADRFQDVWA